MASVVLVFMELVGDPVDDDAAATAALDCCLWDCFGVSDGSRLGGERGCFDIGDAAAVAGELLRRLGVLFFFAGTVED